jgi:hypothetical protein
LDKWSSSKDGKESSEDDSSSEGRLQLHPEDDHHGSGAASWNGLGPSTTNSAEACFRPDVFISNEAWIWPDVFISDEAWLWPDVYEPWLRADVVKNKDRGGLGFFFFF